MTDRIRALTVHLAADVREDDIEPLVEAIRLLRHVGSVDLVVTRHEDYAARERVRLDLETKCYQAIRSVFRTGMVPVDTPKTNEGP